MPEIPRPPSACRAAASPPRRAARVRGRALLAAAACLALWLPPPAGAHNQPVPLDVWGPFLPGTPHCLRAITRATHRCFDTVYALEQGCQDALVRGEPCDAEAVEDAVDDSIRAARAILGQECTLSQLTELGYIGFFDAQSDLTNACVSQARAAVEATYAPARFATPSAVALQCMTDSAAYGRKVLRFILERQRPINERLASRLFPPETRREMLLQVERELSADRARWVTGMLERCPDFSSIYGRSADGYLRTIKQRADCVLSLTYVHTGLICLGQVCGNGIKEATEECDDGNANGNDACALDCTLN